VSNQPNGDEPERGLPGIVNGGPVRTVFTYFAVPMLGALVGSSSPLCIVEAW
jgi:hypothetical protein